jgi:hypothetical protein
MALQQTTRGEDRMGKVEGRAAVARREAPTAKGEVGAADSDDPLCAVAMLRVAVEMKKPDARGLDEIIEGVLERMRLDKQAFRQFLAENGQLLRATAAARGYSR